MECRCKVLPADRQQSRLEETANSLSHGIGCVLALVLLPTSVQTVIARDGVSPHTIALEVFVAATLLLYLCSALGHGLPAGTGKLATRHAGMGLDNVVLTTAVPEPGTDAFMVAGPAGIGAAMRTPWEVRPARRRQIPGAVC